MNNLIVKQVNFMGDSLLATQDEQGNIWAGVKWLCNGIGLSEDQIKNERKKIQSDLILSKGVSNLTLPTNGGKQEVLCLMIDYVPLWLAKISITPAMKEENPKLVEKLIDYQLKVKDILADAFLSKQPPVDTSKLSPELQLFKQMFDTVANQQIKTLELKTQQDKQQTEIEVLKGKIDIINDTEFTVVGYCNMHNIPVDNKTANSLGIKASRLSKQKGYRIGQATHPIWGRVNTYHTDILDIVIDEM